MRICFHKYEVVHQQRMYKYLECTKCGKRKVLDFTWRNNYAGHQPMKYPNWEGKRWCRYEV